MTKTVRTNCPACGLMTSVEEANLGQTVACPSCLSQFQTQLPAGAVVEPAVQMPPVASVVTVESPAKKAPKVPKAPKSTDVPVNPGSHRKRLEHKKAIRAARKERMSKSVSIDRDPLKDWLLYAAVLGGLVMAGASLHLYAAVVSDSSGLCVVIFAFFLIALFLNLRGVLSLRGEFTLAAHIVKRMQAPGGFNEIVKLPPAGVFHQHIADLVFISKFDSNVAQDSLITLLYSRLIRKSRLVELLSGTLVTLGLIGTIIGLISMTNGLSGTLDSLGADGDNDSLLAGMRATMSGLGTAFYTTLVGAILSVVIRILNNVYTTNADHFVTYVAKVSEVRIVPRLKKSARTRDEQEKSGSAAEQLAEEQLGDTN